MRQTSSDKYRSSGGQEEVDVDTIKQTTTTSDSNVTSTTNFFSNNKMSLASTATLSMLILLLVSLASSLSVLFSSSDRATDKATETLALETIIAQSRVVTSLFNKDTNGFLAVKNRTLHQINPFSTSISPPLSEAGKNASIRDWTNYGMSFMASATPGAGIVVRFADGGTAFSAARTDLIKGHICQLIPKSFDLTNPYFPIEPASFCSTDAFLTNDSTPLDTNDPRRTQPGSHYAFHAHLSPLWNITRMLLQPSSSSSSGVNNNKPIGFWNPGFRFVVTEPGARELGRMPKYSFTKSFVTMSFDPHNNNQPVALIYGIIGTGSFGPILRTTLPRGGNDASSKTRAFLLDEKKVVLAMSHVKTPFSVRPLNQTGGVVYQGCSSYGTLQGCFYNYSTFAPYVLLREALKDKTNWTHVDISSNSSGGSSSSSSSSFYSFYSVSQTISRTSFQYSDEEFVAYRISLVDPQFPATYLEVYTVISLDFFVEEVVRARTVTVAIVIVVALLGGVISYVVLRRAVSSLRDLVERMKDPFGARFKTVNHQQQQQQQQQEQEKGNETKSKDSENSISQAELFHRRGEGKNGSNNNKKSGAVIEMYKTKEETSIGRDEENSSLTSKKTDEQEEEEDLRTFWEKLMDFIDWQPEEIGEIETEFAAFRTVIDELRGFLVLPQNNNNKNSNNKTPSTASDTSSLPLSKNKKQSKKKSNTTTTTKTSQKEDSDVSLKKKEKVKFASEEQQQQEEEPSPTATSSRSSPNVVEEQKEEKKRKSVQFSDNLILSCTSSEDDETSGCDSDSSNNSSSSHDKSPSMFSVSDARRISGGGDGSSTSKKKKSSSNNNLSNNFPLVMAVDTTAVSQQVDEEDDKETRAEKNSKSESDDNNNNNNSNNNSNVSSFSSRKIYSGLRPLPKKKVRYAENDLRTCFVAVIHVPTFSNPDLSFCQLTGHRCRLAFFNLTQQIIMSMSSLASSCGAVLVDFQGDHFFLVCQTRDQTRKTKIPTRCATLLGRMSYRINELLSNWNEWREQNAESLRIEALEQQEVVNNNNDINVLGSAFIGRINDNTSPNSSQINNNNNNKNCIALASSSSASTAKTEQQQQQEFKSNFVISAGLSIGSAYLIHNNNSSIEGGGGETSTTSGFIGTFTTRALTFVAPCISEASLVENVLRSNDGQLVKTIKQLTDEEDIYHGNYNQENEALRKNCIQLLSLPFNIGFVVERSNMFESVRGVGVADVKATDVNSLQKETKQQQQNTTAAKKENQQQQQHSAVIRIAYVGKK